MNGFRLHGLSHVDTVRCLRSLPTHIELIIARSPNGPAHSIADVYEAQTDYEGTLRIAASEIGSSQADFDVDYGSNIGGTDYRIRNNSLKTRLTETQPPQAKVTEWVQQSQLGVDTSISQ